jgi:hypothetical protein
VRSWLRLSESALRGCPSRDLAVVAREEGLRVALTFVVMVQFNMRGRQQSITTTNVVECASWQTSGAQTTEGLSSLCHEQLDTLVYQAKSSMNTNAHNSV